MAKQKYTQQQIIEALRETKGMVYLAAKRLGCEAQTIYNYRDRYPAVRAVEISPAYVAVALQRFYDHCGKLPVLVSSE